MKKWKPTLACEELAKRWVTGDLLVVKGSGRDSIAATVMYAKKPESGAWQKGEAVPVGTLLLYLGEVVSIQPTAYSDFRTFAKIWRDNKVWWAALETENGKLRLVTQGRVK